MNSDKEKIEELEAEVKKLKKELNNKNEDYSSWDFHWNGRGDYEEARRCFYGDFG